jgi:diaminohydroxyphosphoribosylaminopyrimidine deaminase/5-amino-6-(5-phosphoribosylamino)uracil reductase
MDTSPHLEYMQLALQLAKRGRYTVSPNPMVGCVIVKDGRIVGQGHHIRAGGPHAEVHALQDAGDLAAGAVAYVTLEPCCHFGRTPPCTQALINARIKKVYFACKDPNPLVAEKVIAILREAGIEVEHGLCESEAKKLNEIFFKYITTRRPFVIAKWAMSLDGKTVTNPGDSRKISGDKSHQHTHAKRQAVDAILVGANTVLADNPELTARSSAEEIIDQPIRVILAGQGVLPPALKVLNGSLPGKTWVAVTEPINAEWKNTLSSAHVELLILPKNAAGKVCLSSLLDELGKREVTSLLVEGGMTVHESFFKENLVDKVHIYLAPVFIGTLPKKIRLENIDIETLGNDYFFSAGCQEVEYV